MPETVTVQLRKPTKDDPGQVTFGHYIVDDGVLIMTDAAGDPVTVDGLRFTHALKPGDSAHMVACVLTRQVRRRIRGETEAQEKFRRRIVYPVAGIA